MALGKGHRMTRDLQPQRDIDREREIGERGEGEREKRPHTGAFQKLLHTEGFTHRH